MSEIDLKFSKIVFFVSNRKMLFDGLDFYIRRTLYSVPSLNIVQPLVYKTVTNLCCSWWDDALMAQKVAGLNPTVDSLLCL